MDKNLSLRNLCSILIYNILENKSFWQSIFYFTAFYKIKSIFGF